MMDNNYSLSTSTFRKYDQLQKVIHKITEVPVIKDVTNNTELTYKSETLEKTLNYITDYFEGQQTISRYTFLELCTELNLLDSYNKIQKEMYASYLELNQVNLPQIIDTLVIDNFTLIEVPHNVMSIDGETYTHVPITIQEICKKQADYYLTIGIKCARFNPDFDAENLKILE